MPEIDSDEYHFPVRCLQMYSDGKIYGNQLSPCITRARDSGEVKFLCGTYQLFLNMDTMPDM